MLKIIFRIASVFFLFLCLNNALAQPAPFNQKTVDSIIAILPASPADTIKVKNLATITSMLMTIKTDQCLKYGNEGLTLARSLGYKYGEVISIKNVAFVLTITGEWLKATQLLYEGIAITEKYFPEKTVSMYSIFALLNDKQGEYKKQLEWGLKAYHHPLFFTLEKDNSQWTIFLTLGQSYERLNRFDSAIYFSNKALEACKKYNLGNLAGFSYAIIGRVQAKLGNYQPALQATHSAIDLLQKQHYDFSVYEIELELAELFDKFHKADSAIYYAALALKGGKEVSNRVVIIGASKILAENYESINQQEAITYFKIFNAERDSLFNAEKLKQIENINYQEQQRISDLKLAEKDYKSRIKQNVLFGILGTLAIVTLLLVINNKQKQKANKVLEATLLNLKSTQSQLIQSEKMASLGELTAGIAHEIQNPLNFVNNFSEVNTELIEEAGEEINKGNIDEVKNILNDIKENEQKINHHGKRADAIVKGMLQHSHSNTGQKEPAGINKLADEYLRLAYQGLRAKDKSFNAILKTDFDETIGKINIVPQDIGRVLLNLFNNAFYAVNEMKQKTTEGYEPIVSVSTKKIGDKVEIKVADNGNGVAPKIMDKIFQPFFTTKPTGQGTGLGLSLSYDFIKAHGGEIKVVTKEGEGTAFIIQLPVV